jgi:hypothetical protein
VSAIGTIVRLPSICPACCRSDTAVTCAGDERHPAALRCRRCGARRGWMSEATHSFIAEVIRNFGTITDPVAIRIGEDATSVAK